MVGSRSPSFAVRRMVSAMAWICAELTGSGSDATAVANAAFMMPIVSGENDAFEKSFMLGSIRRQARASSTLSRRTNKPPPLRDDGSPSPAPTTAPSASPSAATTEQPHEEEQQYRAEGSVDDRADDAAAEMEAKLRQQPTADKGTQDADNNITNDPKACPAYD